MSIIETLSEGYRILSKRIGLLLFPVFLDLLIWQGPKLSAAPVMEQALATLRGLMDAAAASGPGVDSNMMQVFETQADTLRELVGQFNVMALLAWGRLGVPSIAGAQPVDPAGDLVWELTGIGQLLMAQFGLLAIGLILACLFLGAIAQTVRGEAIDWVRLVRRAPTHWASLLAILLPVGMAMVFALSIAPLLGPFSILIVVVLLWLLLYLSFISQAIILSDANPLAALWHSFIIVRTNLMPSLGLVVLINVINTGLGLVWQRLVGLSSVGMAIAIVANAFVGTGLTIATFCFFRDRLTRWYELRAGIQNKETHA